MNVADRRFGFIGGGAMAEALVHGVLAAGLVQAEQVTVSDVSPDRLAYLMKKYHVHTTQDNKTVAEQADVVFFCVKPQVLSTVAREIAAALSPRQLVISIAAGVAIKTIEALVGSEIPVIRVMPNTAALVSAGMAAIARGTSASEAHAALALEIFNAVGRAVVLPETAMDAVTGLSGSAPAYVYLVIEAMADAGVLVGLDRKTALTLAAQTTLGAAQMVLKTGEHPAVLKDRVTSPGGTTIAGVQKLEEGGVRAAFMHAVSAATRRSQELGKNETR